ncbi:DUF397 domain-containing protein [Lentzea flava]|uniref:DUF397 domain-containing protein n=1 Tax=Lentzea flava TaxID=103732 RepID=A0ABQ2VHR3_9PSEU|nr:DUF397 domain-containing protein [Lentzea flava]MCP2205250.1 protein of unknown function (DUF397) [Lentzea flava]GGU85005.1 hypothetical protein GCM10010178_89160 [Lentzea flava]
MDKVRFRKSSYSGGNPEACVEVGFADDGVHVRDSKNTKPVTLAFKPAAWAAFMSSPSVAESTSA